MPIYKDPSDAPWTVSAEAKKAKKKVAEATGKKGRELAKKVAKVGKPKRTVEAGTALVRSYGGGKEWKTVYTKMYTPKQEAKIKSTQRQMKLERERTATRAAAKAKQAAKKKK